MIWAPDKVIQAILRHEDVETTQRSYSVDKKHSSLVTMFDRLRRKRSVALYDDTGFVSRHDAEQALEFARRLIDVIRADVKSAKTLTETRPFVTKKVTGKEPIPAPVQKICIQMIADI